MSFIIFVISVFNELLTAITPSFLTTYNYNFLFLDSTVVKEASEIVKLCLIIFIAGYFVRDLIGIRAAAAIDSLGLTYWISFLIIAAVDDYLEFWENDNHAVLIISILVVISSIVSIAINSFLVRWRSESRHSVHPFTIDFYYLDHQEYDYESVIHYILKGVFNVPRAREIYKAINNFFCIVIVLVNIWYFSAMYYHTSNIPISELIMKISYTKNILIISAIVTIIFFAIQIAISIFLFGPEDEDSTLEQRRYRKQAANEDKKWNKKTSKAIQNPAEAFGEKIEPSVDPVDIVKRKK
jgi:hypothetical protein